MRGIFLAGMTLASMALADAGPTLRCKDANTELVADFHGAEFAMDDYGYVKNVSGPVHVSWSGHELDTSSYAVFLNGPTINVSFYDEANKKNIGVRIEGSLSAGRAIVTSDAIDSFASYGWPMECGLASASVSLAGKR